MAAFFCGLPFLTKIPKRLYLFSKIASKEVLLGNGDQPTCVLPPRSVGGLQLVFFLAALGHHHIRVLFEQVSTLVDM